MKFMVAYDGGSASQHALALARKQALAGPDATLVYIVTSMEGGSAFNARPFNWPGACPRARISSNSPRTTGST